MIEKKKNDDTEKLKSKSCLIYAVLSAVFASLTSILGKIGIEGVGPNLGTAIRTSVVLVMAWVLVFAKGKQHTVKEVSKSELTCICLSGVATGNSWLCYYKALQDGPASAVVPIDKLSIVVSIIFSYIVFKEKLSVKSCIGVVMIIAALWLCCYKLNSFTQNCVICLTIVQKTSTINKVNH